MKRRVRKIVNFFAFNLLFFALYLNFIHKDKQPMAIETEQATQNATAFSGTVLVEKTQQQPQKKAEFVAAASKDINTEKENTTPALKLSIN
jgi:hypothetical protein